MTASDVIERVRLLLGDQEEDAFTDTEIITEMNSVLSEVATELLCYVVGGEVNICEDRNVYDFPDDFIALRQINVDDSLAGRVVIATTYKDALTAGYTMVPQESDLALYYGFVQTSATNPVVFRDTVAANEFLIVPSFAPDDTIIIGETTYWGG